MFKDLSALNKNPKYREHVVNPIDFDQIDRKICGGLYDSFYALLSILIASTTIVSFTIAVSSSRMIPQWDIFSVFLQLIAERHESTKFAKT